MASAVEAARVAFRDAAARHPQRAGAPLAEVARYISGQPRVAAGDRRAGARARARSRRAGHALGTQRGLAERAGAVALSRAGKDEPSACAPEHMVGEAIYLVNVATPTATMYTTVIGSSASASIGRASLRGLRGVGEGPPAGTRSRPGGTLPERSPGGEGGLFPRASLRRVCHLGATMAPPEMSRRIYFPLRSGPSILYICPTPSAARPSREKHPTGPHPSIFGSFCVVCRHRYWQ